MTEQKAWLCVFRTFGLESDPEFKVKQAEPAHHYDPDFIEVSYRQMKGLVVTAVVFADKQPTRERLEAVTRERMNLRLGEITTPAAETAKETER